ncbi:TIGR02281 family clan AA aspartic protease, partial [Bradyrhizobium sp. Pear77]|nr:TIGR02281 family clan AA aspartic protease [Bradyrhizobium altum]
MTRILLVILLLMMTAGAVVAYGDPDQIARARQNLTQIFG